MYMVFMGRPAHCHTLLVGHILIPALGVSMAKFIKILNAHPFVLNCTSRVPVYGNISTWTQKTVHQSNICNSTHIKAVNNQISIKEEH